MSGTRSVSAILWDRCTVCCFADNSRAARALDLDRASEYKRREVLKSAVGGHSRLGRRGIITGESSHILFPFSFSTCMCKKALGRLVIVIDL